MKVKNVKVKKREGKRISQIYVYLIIGIKNNVSHKETKKKEFKKNAYLF